jgi:two-component system NtrC family sensor kinase
MSEFLLHLPRMIVAAALVGTFVFLQRRNREAHVLCWLVGWCLMFVHLGLDLAVQQSALFTPLRLATNEFAGLVFFKSVSLAGCGGRRANWVSAYLGIPVIAFSGLLVFQVTAGWAYALCLLPLFYGGLACAVLRTQIRLLPLSLAVPVAVFGTWVSYRQIQGDIKSGSAGMLLVTFAAAGILFVRRFPRATPGVVASAGGLLTWAVLPALNAWAPAAVRAIGVHSDLWTIPKLFVALGMIVVLLEEESLALQAAGAREHLANLQLQRFAEITSKLLGGMDLKAHAGHIAEVITEATTFRRSAIMLIENDQQLFVAGHSGVGQTELQQMKTCLAKLTLADADHLCQHGQPIGKSAVVVSQEQGQAGERAVQEASVPVIFWSAREHILVPLRSPRGALLGLIGLADPKQPGWGSAVEMSKIEMLAADMAVALDNENMRRQLVTHEKLAGLGQLVRGVAHEINNPLTAVLGYADLLGEQASSENMRRGLATIQREAQRIKAILSNLLRFAQQGVADRKTIDLLPLLQSLLSEKAEEARGRGIELAQNLPAALPQVAVDEAQLRQVFLQVLHNAFEAVANAPEKRVIVAARTEGSLLVLTFVDSGPGFTDVDRVFDPFFTTKSPGKGPGLGLSICYGVLKRHGGNITAHNLNPSGACIAIELPAIISDERMGMSAAVRP